MTAPGELWVGARPEALALETFAVFGKGDTASVIVRKAGAMKAFVRPPDLSSVEAGVGDRSRR